MQCAGPRSRWPADQNGGDPRRLVKRRGYMEDTASSVQREAVTRGAHVEYAELVHCRRPRDRMNGKCLQVVQPPVCSVAHIATGASRSGAARGSVRFAPPATCERGRRSRSPRAARAGCSGALHEQQGLQRAGLPDHCQAQRAGKQTHGRSQPSMRMGQAYGR